ncbi:hypothetical protein MANES_08G092911v8 [Manihot esculenta]|uniref:Uncharacterized protein n=1 Tax=Manihot esculenta TaxID=3983 RepID=A0ACB7HAC7_MANES|nr:hypothetical protein MANES_08G092911v8 [Manihot esculenta]
MATTTNNDHLQNSSNPYFLHPNENSALILVSPAKAMKMVLSSKNKLQFINEYFTRNNYEIRFLKWLNDQFANVKSQIMTMDPLPNVNKVFSLVLQQERQNSNGHVIESEAFVNKTVRNYVSYGNSGYGRGHFTIGRGSRSIKVCTYCGKYKHTVDTCYRKHGFPPSFQFMNSNANIVSVEHRNSNANAIFDDHNEPVLQVPNEPYTSKEADSFKFTTEQYQRLLNLI